MLLLCGGILCSSRNLAITPKDFVERISRGEEEAASKEVEEEYVKPIIKIIENFREIVEKGLEPVFVSPADSLTQYYKNLNDFITEAITYVDNTYPKNKVLKKTILENLPLQKIMKRTLSFKFYDKYPKEALELLKPYREFLKNNYYKSSLSKLYTQLDNLINKIEAYLRKLPKNDALQDLAAALNELNNKLNQLSTDLR